MKSRGARQVTVTGRYCEARDSMEMRSWSAHINPRNLSASAVTAFAPAWLRPADAALSPAGGPRAASGCPP